MKRLPLFCFLQNFLLAYIAFMICRIVYVAVNWQTLGSALSSNSFSDLLCGSLLFDTSALFYLNALVLLLTLLPWHQKETNQFHQSVRIIYTVLNGIGIIANLADSVYFAYTGRRTTATIFSEFSNEGNLGDIVGTEIINHWYLVLIGLALIVALYACYRKPNLQTQSKPRSTTFYYITQTLSLALMAWLTICGMRGGFTHAVRPITISNANQYVAHPTETAIVLNTPFSIIRTIGKKTFTNPNYFDTKEALNQYYTAEHTPADSLAFTPRNVVVLICESLGMEYYGSYNQQLEGGQYKGFTPFLDSLCERSMTYKFSFSNGRKSIDGMPSILSSIPMFVEPFFLTPASLNTIGGLARSLNSKGYETAFFHGAENGSMGFEAFSRSSGFQQYYGRTEYNADPNFNGDKDFDGMWAIWDEPFLQYFSQTMTKELHEPFMTAVFTASSHHPFNIPEQYRDTFPEEQIPMQKCIRYLDHSLRRFFQHASQQPWYDHTLFVITGDHTNQSCHAEYQTDLGLYCVPVLFFDPTGETFLAGRRDGISQQIDIMPTLLSALHYDEPYVAFGLDLLSTPADSTWAINYNNGIYQYVSHDHLLLFDGQKATGLFDLNNDWMLQNNLLGQRDSLQYEQEQHTRAIIQDYMERMNEDRLILK